MNTTKLNVHHSRIRITPAAELLFERHDETATALIARHLAGDWGDCDEEDSEANDQAVELGSRTLGAYPVGKDKVWIIADAWLSDNHHVKFEGRMFGPKERYALTVLLPEDY